MISDARVVSSCLALHILDGLAVPLFGLDTLNHHTDLSLGPF
jgi:hypothetical protein